MRATHTSRPTRGRGPTGLVLSAGILAALLSGCGAPSFEAPSTGTDGAARTEAPTAAELLSARLTGFEEEVELVDGAWEGEPYVEGGASRPALSLVDLDPLSGDLDGDGIDEAVAVVSETSGGTGNNFHLVAFEHRSGTAVEQASVLVGDRVQIRSFGIEGTTVVLRLVQAGAEDAACCPGEKVVRRWTLSDAGWQETEPTFEGRLTTADLGETSWRLSHFSWDEEAPGEPPVTLTWEDGQLSGSSGCNRYTTSIEDGETPGEVVVGAIAGTRRACPPAAMEVEQRYIQALGGATKFSFMAEDLALTYVLEQQWRTLRFRADPEPDLGD